MSSVYANCPHCGYRTQQTLNEDGNWVCEECGQEVTEEEEVRNANVHPVFQGILNSISMGVRK